MPTTFNTPNNPKCSICDKYVRSGILCNICNRWSPYLWRYHLCLAEVCADICCFVLSVLSVCLCPCVCIFNFIMVCPGNFYFHEYITKKEKKKMEPC